MYKELQDLFNFLIQKKISQVGRYPLYKVYENPENSQTAELTNKVDIYIPITNTGT